MGGMTMLDRKRPFGLVLSSNSARDIAGAATQIRRKPEDGIGLVVTPNIDHIAIIRRSAAMANAYKNAERIVCDGWPVQLYARLCGARLSRVTGCEITSELMRMAPYPSWQRFFRCRYRCNRGRGPRMGEAQPFGGRLRDDHTAVWF